MTLSLERELALFEILQVPYQTSVMKLQPEDNLTAIEYTADNLATQAFGLIQDKITEIEANAELLALLEGHLDSWVALGTNVTNLQGNVGDIGGIDDSPDRERQAIRAKVITIVPFYRHHDEMVSPTPRNMNGSIYR